MAASQASRYAARLAGAAVGGAIAVKALDLSGDGDTGAPGDQQQHGGRRRPGLLQHVRVDVKGDGLGTLPLADRPAWLPLPEALPQPPSEEQAASPPPSEQQQEEEAQPPPPAGPPALSTRPLVFVTAADGCLLDNLVEDILALGADSGAPRVHVSFAPTAVGGSGEQGQQLQMRMRRADGSAGAGEGENGGDSLLTRLWEGLGLIGRPIVEPQGQEDEEGEQGEEQHQESSLLEIERLLSASPNDGGTVVVDVSRLVAAAPGTEAGKAAGAVLRSLFAFARAEPQRRHQVVFTAASPLGLWKAQLLATGKGALPSVEPVEQVQKQGEESESAGPKELLGATVLHVQVQGMNRPLRDLLVSEAEAEAAMLVSQAPAPAPAAEAAAQAPKAELEAGEGTFSEEGAPPPADDALLESAAVDIKADLAPLLRLGPGLGALFDVLSAPSSGVDAAVATEEARLRAALEAEEGNGALGVLLWDVLGALHGERLDVVTRARLGLGEPGALPLEVLVHLCSEESDLLGKLEGLMAAGWLQVQHPELLLISAPAPAPAATTTDAGGDEPSFLTTDPPTVLCRAAAEPLGEVPLPFSNATLITTPALATLAWRGVARDADLNRRMDARSDARHVEQQAAVLRGQRLALQAEWAQLAAGRRALEERRGELQAGEFAALQLELIRLEKGAASRAHEMRHRAAHLAALRARLAEALPAAQVPPAELLAAPNVHAGDPSMPPLSIEERVLLDIDRGLRAVPVEWLPGSGGGGGGGRRWEGVSWWGRVRGWGARWLPGAGRKGGGE